MNHLSINPNQPRYFQWNIINEICQYLDTPNFGRLLTLNDIIGEQTEIQYENRQTYEKAVLTEFFMKNKPLYLELGGRYNNEEITSFLSNLENLQRLDLHNNGLITLPREIGNLVNLQYLYLEYNGLMTLPEEIGNLVNLQILYLQYNSLKTLPEEIGKLVNLKRLYLDNNYLRTLPKEIGNLVNLELFEFTNNPWTTLPKKLESLVKKFNAVVFNNVTFV